MSNGKGHSMKSEAEIRRYLDDLCTALEWIDEDRAGECEEKEAAARMMFVQGKTLAWVLGLDDSIQKLVDTLADNVRTGKEEETEAAGS